MFNEFDVEEVKNLEDFNNWLFDNQLGGEVIEREGEYFYVVDRSEKFLANNIENAFKLVRREYLSRYNMALDTYLVKM